MDDDIREQVRQKYAQAIKSKTGCGGSTGCCGDGQQIVPNYRSRRTVQCLY